MTLARELLDQGDKETVLGGTFSNTARRLLEGRQTERLNWRVKQGWVPDFGANLV